jgi:LCP family protein required for cell wall assembly
VVKEVQRPEKGTKPQGKVNTAHKPKQPVGTISRKKQQKAQTAIVVSGSGWLSKSLTMFVGVTLAGISVAGLALWTPLWSKTDAPEDELDLAADTEKHTVPLPAELWRNISEYKLSKPMNILILGSEPIAGTADGSPESFSGESETMLLVRFSPNSNTIRVLSIPADSMAAVPEMGLTKLSMANARGGSVFATRVISRTLNNVRIDRYIRLSSNSLREVVDQLGGVDVFVPQDMVHKDSAGKLTMGLASGWQTLNGEEAENFVRFRENAPGDLRRVQRHQLLLKAFRERLSSPTVLTRLPQLARTMRNYLDTNLSLEEIWALLNFSLSQEPNKLQMFLLPGSLSPLSQDPNSYWIDFSQQHRILQDYFGVNIGGVQEDTRSLYQMSIAVQNASNKPQLTQKVINFLKSNGFTKVYAAPDWKDNQSQTQIISQQGNQEAATELQKLLGLGNIEVSATGDLQSDLTIRIGRDWKK